MTNEEIKILLKAYEDYLDNCTNFESDVRIILSLENKKSLYELFLDPIEAKKIIIKNTYGLFGNLLYKYRNDLSNELIEYFIKKDVKFISRSARLSESNISFIPYEIRSNKALMRMLIAILPSLMYISTDDIRMDKEIIFEALFANVPEIYEFISEHLKNDRSFILEAVNVCPRVFKYVDNDFKDDKELATKALMYEPLMYSDLSLNIRNDKDIFLYLLGREETKNYIIDYVGDDILDDKEVMLEFANKFKSDWDVMKYFNRLDAWDEDMLKACLYERNYCFYSFIFYDSFLKNRTNVIKDYFSCVARIINYKFDINFFVSEKICEIVAEYLDYIIKFAKKKIMISVTPEIYESVYNKYGTKYNKYIKCDEMEIYDEELPF